MPTALVTGASSGIGRTTAIGLGRDGFHVLAAGRSAERTGPVIEEIAADGGSAEFIGLDLASLKSVRLAGAQVLGSGRTVDVLINNAGIGVNRRGLTEDGFEVHFGINHLGHFLLARELAPMLGSRTRVVSLTSDMHHRADGIDLSLVRRPTRLIGLAEYATSKLANLLFARELARRRPEVLSYAVHPGLVDTPLLPSYIRLLAGSRMLTPEQGADTVLWCATSEPAPADNGGYYTQRSPAAPSPHALDDDLAGELWERSEEFCR